MALGDQTAHVVARVVADLAGTIDPLDAEACQVVIVLNGAAREVGLADDPTHGVVFKTVEFATLIFNSANAGLQIIAKAQCSAGRLVHPRKLVESSITVFVRTAIGGHSASNKAFGIVIPVQA